jgi:hypothetical protein
MLHFIRDVLKAQPDLYLDEIQEALYLMGGEEWLVSLDAIWRVLTKTLN